MFAGLNLSTYSYLAIASSHLPASCSLMPASIVAVSATVEAVDGRVGGALDWAVATIGGRATLKQRTVRLRIRMQEYAF